MKRIAQAVNTQNDDAVEQSVMLSPRTLLTGPRQIVRLERQYRSLSEDLQNALENLNRTKDSYVSALHTFEQAEEYIRQLGPKVRMAVMLLNSARTNPQYLGRAEGAIEGIVGGGASAAPESVASAPGKNSTGSNHSMTRTAGDLLNQARSTLWTARAPGATPEDFSAAAQAAKAYSIDLRIRADEDKNPQYSEYAASWENVYREFTDKAKGTNTTNTSANTSEQSGNNTNVTPAPDPQQQAMFAQQISTLQTQLSTFVNEMHRRYNMHKQRATAMEGQYNMSKVAYAKVRAEFFQMQTEISSLSANLSGWNERLSEYYAPSGGEA